MRNTFGGGGGIGERGVTPSLRTNTDGHHKTKRLRLEYGKENTGCLGVSCQRVRVNCRRPRLCVLGSTSRLLSPRVVDKKQVPKTNGRGQ